MARKGPPFLHAVGECRDTRTGWLGELDSNRRDAVDLMYRNGVRTVMVGAYVKNMLAADTPDANISILSCIRLRIGIRIHQE